MQQKKSLQLSKNLERNHEPFLSGTFEKSDTAFSSSRILTKLSKSQDYPHILWKKKQAAAQFVLSSFPSGQTGLHTRIPGLANRQQETFPSSRYILGNPKHVFFIKNHQLCSMKILHNRVSQAELKERLMAETFKRITISFYRYAHIEDPLQFRDDLYKNLFQLNAFGRIYVASEGINGQMSVPESAFENLKEYLYSIPALDGIRLNVAVDDDGKSFWVLKVKVREKIVADGIDDPSFDMRNKGKYVDARAFNRLTDDPNTVVVDMRNHYEYEVGHFQNAIEVPSETFREQLPMAVEMLKDKKDANIIMYCTGGIRCEKASAYFLHQGFQNVYHLEGGIINYARNVEQSGLPNKFLGKNFVFDGRLGERIGDEVISHCHQCGKACDTHVNCANEGCHLLFIQCSDCAEKYNHCCSQECKETLALPLEVRKTRRKGIKNGRKIFNNKSRRRMDSLRVG